MNKTKPNISLQSLAETDNCGIWLSLRKGINELFHKSKPQRRSAVQHPGGIYSDILSVIICSSNPPHLAAKAAESAARQGFEKTEIIVVNNSDTDYKSEDFGEGIRIVREGRRGLSNARNTGANAASGEYLLYIDDDAELCGGSLAAVYNSYQKHPDTAIIGGQIYVQIPNPQPPVFLEGRESLWSGYTVSYKAFRHIKEHYEFPYGACFSVRHSALDAMGGFPTDYGREGGNFAGGEETALCFLAKRLGMKIGIEPSASVLHHVAAERFSENHVRRTIREGIFTTHRLFLDGYADYGWTEAYIDERIKIIKSELCRLKSRGDSLPAFYKRCELDAFSELYEEYFKNQG